MKISSVLSTKGTNVVTIRPEQTLKEAATLLGLHNIGALIAVDANGRPVGILSERDIVRELARTDDISSLPVSRIMTRGLVTGTPQDDLHAVLRTMTEKRFRHLPITEDGKLVGIISIGDMVKAQLSEYQGEIDTLESRVAGD